MRSAHVQLSVPLSHLVPSRRNPRKVKPGRDAHHRLVALIRSQGLLQPLVVRSIEGKPKRYEVVAGDRRLRALREIHRDNGDPKIPCVLRDVDAATADALSLGENFAREAMHPLDEAMKAAPREFDEHTNRKLAKLSARRQKLEHTAEKIGEGDETRLQRLQQRYEELETEENEIVDQAPEHFSEETKAIGTSFLILDPDGRVHREHRIPRPRHRSPSDGRSHAGMGGAAERPKAPTSDELSDKQLAVTFTHQALAVREALLENTIARKRVLALILHEKVRSEALAVRRDPNGVTLHANGEGFSSAAFDRMRQKRAKLDLFHDQHFVEDWHGYERLGELSAFKLDALIDLLIAESITAHTQRQTDLVHRLAVELKINVRDHWRPDSAWLSAFQKIQLVQLISELKGAVHAPSPERKKSDLVSSLAKLFSDAAEGKLEDKQLAERVNRWLPSNLREVKEDATDEEHIPQRKRS